MNADAFVAPDGATHIQPDLEKAEEQPIKLQTNPKQDANVPCQKIAELYNTVLGEQLPKVQMLTERRRKAIIARWKQVKNTTAPNGKVRFSNEEEGLKWFEAVFRKTMLNSFWMGENDSGFAINFDWIFKPTNFVKILEWYPPKKTGA